MHPILKVVGIILIFNLIFTLIAMTWITEDDVSGIPEPPLDRFNSIFFSGITIFASTGFGDMMPKSKRMKIFMSIHMILSFLIIKYYL